MTGINSNYGAAIAQSNLSRNSNGLDNIAKRIASGLRINSAMDDAAGLAISERFAALSAGYSASQRAVNYSIGFYQVQDGALGSINENLQRMREIGVQGANGTLTADQRAALNFEYQGLVAENDRIIQNTTYNGVRVFSDDGLVTSTNIDGRGNRINLTTYNSLTDQSRGINRVGSLSSFWNQVQVPGRDPSTQYTNGGFFTLNNNPIARGGAITNYSVNTASVGGFQTLRDVGVVAGFPYGSNAVAANTTNTNTTDFSVVGTPATGTYNVTVDQIAQGYNYTDNIGAGTFGYGAQNASAAGGSSNAGVATADNNPVAQGTYAITVGSLASNQVTRSNNTGGGGGQNATIGASTDSTNVFNVTYGGVSFVVDIADGTFTDADFISAFNTAAGLAGANVVASQDGTRIRYTGGNFGATETLTVTNNSQRNNVVGTTVADANSDVYEINQTVTAASNANYSVSFTDLNGAVTNFGAFTGTTNDNITVGGLQFDLNGTGTTNIVQRNASVSQFRIDFGDGTPSSTFTLNGAYTKADYIAAYNAAAGGKFTATDGGGTVINYTGNEKGADEFMSVTALTNNSAAGFGNVNDNRFNVAGAEETQTGRNFEGRVNNGGGDVAFNDKDGQNITVGGVSFNINEATAVNGDSTTITRTAVIDDSVNRFTVNYRTGGSVTFTVGSGDFSVADYISAYNSANAGRSQVQIVGGDLQYTTLRTGQDNEILSMTDGSTQTVGGISGAIATNNALQFTEAGEETVDATNYVGTVNGVAFNSSSDTFDLIVGGDTLDLTILTTGVDDVDFDPGTDPINDARFGQLNSAQNSRDQLGLIDLYMDLVNNSRAQAGSFTSRLESISNDLSTQILSLELSRDRIVSADFAVETARLTKIQILTQAGIAVLGQANTNNLTALRMLEGLGG